MADSMVQACDLEAEDRFLLSESMSNASGCTHLTLTLAHGATAIIVEGIDTSTLAATLRQTRPTIMSVMGKGNIDILQEPTLAREDFQSVRFNFTGGDKISPAFIRSFEAKTGVHIRYGYGMSECLLIAVNKSTSSTKYGSVGLPCPSTSLMLCDESGQQVRRGETGEIWVQGENIMQGYWANPQASAAVLVDGWLRSGDLAWQDDEGYLWISSRLKNIIIRNGDNISPYEIEEVLASHPCVKIAGVIGIADDNEGAVPAVAIELAAPCTQAEIEQFLQERLN